MALEAGLLNRACVVCSWAPADWLEGPWSQSIIPSRCSLVSLSSPTSQPPEQPPQSLAGLLLKDPPAKGKVSHTPPSPWPQADSIWGEGWLQRVTSGDPRLLLRSKVGETTVLEASWGILSLPLSALS